MKPTLHNSTHQTANVHIDRIRILAPCTHTPTGKTLFLDEESLAELVPVGATANQLVLKDGGEKAYVRSKDIDSSTGKATMMEVHCCPPLVLQRHNLFGHGDLLRYAYQIMDLVTKRLGINVDSFERDEWRRGGIRLTEIHLTANFGCPRGDVLPIIQAIDDNSPDAKQRTIASSITLGYSPRRRSTFDMVTVYDKKLELESQWKTPGHYQRMLIAEAAKGIRAEVKLYSQGLRHRELHSVSRWKDVDVAALFFECLAKYKLGYAIKRLLTKDEMNMLSNTERKAYQLWLTGMPIAEQFSRTTAWKYAKNILKKTGIDISGSRRPEALPEIDMAAVFVPENVLPVPDWARGTECYFAPGQTRLRPPGLAYIPIPPDAVDEVIMLDGEPYVI